MKIGTVTVIGANGTMGCGVAGISASFGDAKVYTIARKIEKAEMAKEMAALSVKAQAIEDNLIPLEVLPPLIMCSLWEDKRGRE